MGERDNDRTVHYFPSPCSRPGVFHVRNSKEFHPVLPVKVRPVPLTHHFILIPIPDPHELPDYPTTPSLALPSHFSSRHVCAPLLPYTTLFLTLEFIHHSVAALLAIGEQLNIILNFFLRRNLAIAKQRVWEQTVSSRGKGPTFWKPYVEEWDRPPVITKPGWDSWLSGSAARFVIRRSKLELFGQSTSVGRSCSTQWLIRFSNAVLLYPVQIYPFIGLFVSAYLKALGTGTYLHKPVRRHHCHHRLRFRTKPYWWMFAHAKTCSTSRPKG